MTLAEKRKRQKKIVKDYTSEDFNGTFEDLAKKYGLSRQGVYHILYKRGMIIKRKPVFLELECSECGKSIKRRPSQNRHSKPYCTKECYVQSLRKDNYHKQIVQDYLDGAEVKDLMKKYDLSRQHIDRMILTHVGRRRYQVDRNALKIKKLFKKK